MSLKTVRLGDVLLYEQPTKYIVSTENYDDRFNTPVLTAGKSFVLGYTDEEENIYDNLPAIIFDDFTTESKYVDFRFKVKSSAMKILTTDPEKADIWYIYYLLQTLNVDTEQHKRYWISKFANIEVYLPPLPVQKQIADTLDKADALRRKDQALLQKYDELAQSIFYDMFGDLFEPSSNSASVHLSEIGEIVSGVAKNTRVVQDDYVEVPYMRVANVQDGHISLKEVKTILVSPQDFNKYRLQENDLLLTEGGDPDKLGRGAVWTGEISPCIHQNHIFRIRITDTRVHPIFLTWVLSSRYGKAYFLKSAKQTTGIASINMTQLKNFKFVIPDKKLQTTFAAIIENIEKQKLRIIQQQYYSENLFHAITQKTFFH